MIDVAIAIDAESRPVVLRKLTSDYDPDTGKAIISNAGYPTIRAAIQPMNGKDSRDLPEGIRTEAKFLAWSREDLKLNDVIADKVSPIVTELFKIIFVWPRRPIDGFSKVALGFIGEERAAP